MITLCDRLAKLGAPTFGTPAMGTIAYSATGTLTVTYPAGIVAGDLLVTFMGTKGSVDGSSTGVAAMSGWTESGKRLLGGGYTTGQLGIDTGNTSLWAFHRIAAGTESGTTFNYTLTNNNVAWGVVIRVPVSGQGTVSIAYGEVSQTVAGNTNLPLPLSPTVATYSGDICLWGMCIPTDVTTPSQFSAQVLTSTQGTFGTTTELGEPDSSLGNDIGGFLAWTRANGNGSGTAGTISAKYTVGGTTTNTRGPILLIRAHIQ